MVDPFYAPQQPVARTAREGLWWMVAAIGIGVLLLAQVILFFSHFDTISSSNKAGAIFGLLGHLALIIGLTLASLLQTSLSWGVRTALLLGAAFFVLGLGGFSNLPGF